MNSLQIELNEKFPLTEREQKIAAGSGDSLGNVVVCYRYMQREVLDRILNNNITTHHNYVGDDKYDMNKFYHNVLEKYIDYLSRNKNVCSKLFFENKSILDFNDIEGIEHIANTISQSSFGISIDVNEILKSRHNIIDFLLENFDSNYLKKMHAGSLGLEFSPYFSWGIGGYSGLFVKCIDYSGFYVEAIIPDGEIISSNTSFNGEKEILTTSISNEWITRIYTSSELLASETLGENFGYCDIGIRNYFFEKLDKGELHEYKDILKLDNLVNIANSWRFDSKTELYLPLKLPNSN